MFIKYDLITLTCRGSYTRDISRDHGKCPDCMTGVKENREVARRTAESMKNACRGENRIRREFIATDELGQQGNSIRTRCARTRGAVETFRSLRRNTMSFGPKRKSACLSFERRKTKSSKFIRN